MTKYYDSMNSENTSSNLLRRSLMGNAIFSSISAAAFLIFHEAIAEFIGLDQSKILVAVGVSLLLFAGGLFRNAVRRNPDLMEAAIAVSLDLAWVAGSVGVLLMNLLSKEGNWAVVAIADVVLVFAILQWVGLRRVKASASLSAVKSQ